MDYHPRAAEPHNGPDSLTHIRAVAPRRTLGLGVVELAAVQPLNWVTISHL